LDSDFLLIYRFRLLGGLVLFNKMKIAQTAATVLVLAPYFVYMASQGEVHPNTAAAGEKKISVTLYA
jgi:hypothetical protein